MRGSSGTEDSDLPRIGTAAAPVTVRGGSGQRGGSRTLSALGEHCRSCTPRFFVRARSAGVLGGGGNGWEAGLSLKG
jgi:hypothetical protein